MEETRTAEEQRAECPQAQQEKDFPERFREVTKKVRKNHGMTLELANELAELASMDGAWLYGTLFFRTPRRTALTGITDIDDLDKESGNFATLEFTAPNGRHIALYTSGDYAQNVVESINFPEFPFGYAVKLSLASAVKRAKSLMLDGIIINPDSDGVTISVRQAKSA